MSSLGYVILPAAQPGHTEAVRYDVFVAGLFKNAIGDRAATMNRLHAAVGIIGEAGELLDAVKKEWIYNKPLDHTNVLEELGDLRFYMQAMMTHCGITEQEVLQYNADKLAKRYVGLKYSDHAAIERADKQE
jgi:NTP pyrophosphatase (non-canonical NTP hydrolase)